MWLRAVLAVALVALAGCGDRPAPTVDPVAPGPPPMAAARQLAATWDGQAELGAVAGFESSGPPSLRPEGLEEGFFAPLFEQIDPDVGDGNAAAWLFVFVSPGLADARFEAVLAADGAVLAQREKAHFTRLGALPRDLEPITPAITEFLDDLAAGWRAGASPTGISWTLAADGAAVWTVGGAVDADGNARSFAFDAYTATLLSPLGTATDPLQREMTDGDGNLQVPNTITIGEFTLEASERLRLDDPHAEFVAVVTPKDATTAPITAVLVSPDGAEHALEGGRVVVPWPKPGTWFLNMTTDAPGGTGYSFMMCAPGDGPEQACPDQA